MYRRDPMRQSHQTAYPTQIPSSQRNQEGGYEGVPLWKRLYVGRIVACVLVVASVVFFVVQGTRASAVHEDAESSPSQDKVISDDELSLPEGAFSQLDPTEISGTWDEELNVSEWTYVKPLRVAHQKNSDDRMEAAAGFDAIEVDIRGATDDGDDYKLVHDNYHGYTLRQFLADCKKQHQIAVLDMKADADPEGATDVVTEEGMIGHTIFQVSSGSIAKTICKRNDKALCWLLNGAGSESDLREDELKEYAEYLVGVNICGSVVGTDRAEEIISAVHSITGRDETPLDICIFAYGTRTDVYGNDELYTKLGVDCLMTDVCPDREQRALMDID